MLHRSFALALTATVLVVGCNHGGVMAEEQPPVPSHPEEGTVVTGTGILEAGVECPMIRTGDGRAYAIHRGGPADLLQMTGRSVTFSGRVMLDSHCMQGIALTIDVLEPD